MKRLAAVMKPLLALVLLAAAAAVTPAAAQGDEESAPLPVDVGAELRALRRSVDQLARSFEALTRLQRAEVWLQRIVIAERRIEPLERELRDARSARDDRGRESGKLSTMLRELEKNIDAAQLAGNESELRQHRNQKDLIEQMLELREDERRDFEARVLDLDAQLARAREAISALEEQLDGLLELDE